jgi:hypothetical protein
MNKKAYQKPAVKKVRLDVSSAVLGVCRVTGDFASREYNSDCKTISPLDPCVA